MRGIDMEFAEAFKKSELFPLYQSHSDELFIGVRDNYLNLYYNCDSVAKVEYTKKRIICGIDRYYLDGKHYTGKDKKTSLTPDEIRERYDTIKSYMNMENSKKLEKRAQSKLIIQNNKNKDSKWFCIDIEWRKAFENMQQRRDAGFNACFDIIAISKESPHKVALIELKYGHFAIGGRSGICKHIEDFYKYQEKEYFNRQEIIDVIKSQEMIGVNAPDELKNLEIKNIAGYGFYVITLNNNGETGRHSTPKQSMAAYLFKEKRWGCIKLPKKTICVEEKFGDVTSRSNKIQVSFLFSKQTLNNLDINDIIDGAYDNREIPQ